MAAMTLADRVATERGEILGQTVGVSISFVDRCSEQTHIKVSLAECQDIEKASNKTQYHITVHDRGHSTARNAR